MNRAPLNRRLRVPPAGDVVIASIGRGDGRGRWPGIADVIILDAGEDGAALGARIDRVFARHPGCRVVVARLGPRAVVATSGGAGEAVRLPVPGGLRQAGLLGLLAHRRLVEGGGLHEVRRAWRAAHLLSPRCPRPGRPGAGPWTRPAGPRAGGRFRAP